MGKKVILTEAQFKDYMRSIKGKLNEQNDNNTRMLEPEELDALLHKMVDNDFECIFNNGRKYWCAYLHEKAEIFYAVCTSHPEICTNGLIRLSNDNYGVFYIENLINAKL